MDNRRYSSNIMYPFVPGDRIIMPYKAGLVDCLFVIDRSYPAGPSVAPPARPKVEMHAMICDPTGNTYKFRYVSSTGAIGLMEFFVPAASGFVRVADGDSVIVVNSDIMYSGAAGPVSLPVIPEIEPARVSWRLEEVVSVSLVNEERRYNPANRANLANTTLISFNTDGDVIKLVDGYNCSLSYDDSSGTLTINAAPGAGKGLPADIPWDDTPPDINNGVKTINGIGYVDNIGIEVGGSLVLNRAAAKITLAILEDKEQ